MSLKEAGLPVHVLNKVPRRAPAVIASLLCLCLVEGAAGQSSETAGATSEAMVDPIPLKRRPSNPLDIPTIESDPDMRTDAADRVRSRHSSARSLDSLRDQRLEDSTQRFRPRLPTRDEAGSVDARANDRLINPRSTRPTGTRFRTTGSRRDW